METTTRRDQILDVAMRHFAEHGYRSTRVEDVARDVGVAKGTVFLHFGSKEGLFLAAYERAVGMLPAWLAAPADVVDRGFWSVLEYWLERTEADLAEAWIPNRVAMLGRLDADLSIRRPIARFMRSEDPYGSLDFVEFGIARGDLRADLDVEMMTAMLDWAAERFQDVLGSEELDPGLVRRRSAAPDRRAARIREFVEILRGGLAAR
jgi:TetR/AcrR family transcriptional regulator